MSNACFFGRHLFFFADYDMEANLSLLLSSYNTAFIVNTPLVLDLLKGIESKRRIMELMAYGKQ